MKSILQTAANIKRTSKPRIHNPSHGIADTNRNTSIDCPVQLDPKMPSFTTLVSYARKHGIGQIRKLCNRKQVRMVGSSHKHLTDFLPDAFRYRSRQKAMKKWDVIKANIAVTGLSGFHYVIHLKGLGLERYQTSIHIYDEAAIKKIKKVLSKLIVGPYHVSLEVGEHHRLHVHVIASRQPNHDQMLEQGVIYEAIKIRDDGLVSYLCKPKVHYDFELAGEHILAQAISKKLGSKLLRTSWLKNTTRKGY